MSEHGQSAMKKAVIEAPVKTECLIDRITEKGARLHLPASCEIPIEFLIRIEGEQVTRYCAVAQRKPDKTQVYFV